MCEVLLVLFGCNLVGVQFCVCWLCPLEAFAT